MKFPMNTRVYVDTNGKRDFYVMHCECEWYIEAYPAGTMDCTRKTIAGVSTKRTALECVEAWKGWMK